MHRSTEAACDFTGVDAAIGLPDSGHFGHRTLWTRTRHFGTNFMVPKCLVAEVSIALTNVLLLNTTVGGTDNTDGLVA